MRDRERGARVPPASVNAARASGDALSADILAMARRRTEQGQRITAMGDSTGAWAPSIHSSAEPGHLSSRIYPCVSMPVDSSPLASRPSAGSASSECSGDGSPAAPITPPDSAPAPAADAGSPPTIPSSCSSPFR